MAAELQPSAYADPADTASETGVCTHCGLPVPAGSMERGAAEQFCCAGCRTVYRAVKELGLGRFYALRAEATADAAPARTTDHTYYEFDDPVFHARHVRVRDNGGRIAELYLEGVHCSACVWLVEKLPQILLGVMSTRLDLRRALVEITWQHEAVTLSRIARVLDSLGYPPHPARDTQARELRRREDHRLLVRIGVAAACAGNAMTIAFALYGGGISGIEAEYEAFFRWVSLGLGVLALAWPGNLFYRGAWAALRTRTAHLDVPIALGLTAGAAAGAVHVATGHGDVYFDSLTVLVLLLLVGRWIQSRQQRGAADAVELLYALTPTSVRVVRDGDVREVSIEAVQRDEIVEVRAGESIAIDGEVVFGHSSVDQSLLTGETQAVEVGPGTRVNAGTTNVAALLRVRVEATGEQTRVGRLMRLVERCAEQRGPIVRLADRVAGWFVPVVLVLAGVTLIVWLRLDPERAVEHAVALLIVTCPCALGLATPLAVTVAIGRAAKRGLLIKGGEILEALARPGYLLLDKTGTLTQGRLALVTWRGDESVKALVAALEARSSHPLARAFVAALRPTADRAATTAPEPTVAEICQTPGAGIEGCVGGHRLIIGAPAFVRARGTTVSEALAQAERQLVDAAQTPVLIACDGRCAAVAGFADPLRPDAAATLVELRRLGWRLGIASGDHERVVAAVARQLGIDPANAQGGMGPEQKLARVQTGEYPRPLVMVGDGVNDAAALSAATVGIAVQGSAEASLAAADVYVSRAGLTPLIELVLAARRTMRTIRRGLAASLCYNALAAALAMAGVIGPLLAAILMPLSSFTVLTLALSARTFGDRSCR